MAHGLDLVEFRPRLSDRPLPSPPAELKPLPPALQRRLGILWIACLLLAIFAEAGATWLVYSYRFHAEPDFASVGLISNLNRKAGASYSHISFEPGSEAMRSAGVTRGATIERINGRAVPDGAHAGELARLLRGPDGTPAEIRLAWQAEGAAERTAHGFRVVRSAENRVQTYTASQRTFRIASQVLDLGIAMLLIGCAAILRRRRFADPVATLVSFASLFLAMVGTWRLWALLGIPSVEMLFEAAWLALFLVALPAFPSGRYVPAWSR